MGDSSGVMKSAGARAEPTDVSVSCITQNSLMPVMPYTGSNANGFRQNYSENRSGTRGGELSVSPLSRALRGTLTLASTPDY